MKKGDVGMANRFFYDKNDIVCPPVAAGYRGQFIFNDLLN